MRRRFLLLGAVGLLAVLAAAPARAYDWPIEPFDQVHAVRAYFGDPRREASQVSFHFGIDIQAPDGTPVYAVEAGQVHLHTGGLAVRALDGSGTFGYWHVAPAVENRALVGRHQLLGTVEPGWGHVHLAERRGGRYVNPLRPGGIAPYEDYTSPTIAGVSFSRDNLEVGRRHVTGLVDLAVDAYDTPSVRMRPPWAGTRVVPALVRWRIVSGTAAVERWRTAVDFRLHEPDQEQFDAVYAPGTVENRAGRPGRYRLFLARGWDSASLPNGPHRLEIEASDTRGNTARAGIAFTIAN